MHGFHHLAKVRVAGSNPVVRSRWPAQSHNPVLYTRRSAVTLSSLDSLDSLVHSLVCCATPVHACQSRQSRQRTVGERDETVAGEFNVALAVGVSQGEAGDSLYSVCKMPFRCVMPDAYIMNRTRYRLTSMTEW